MNRHVLRSTGSRAQLTEPDRLLSDEIELDRFAALQNHGLGMPPRRPYDPHVRPIRRLRACGRGNRCFTVICT